MSEDEMNKRLREKLNDPNASEEDKKTIQKLLDDAEDIDNGLYEDLKKIL